MSVATQLVASTLLCLHPPVSSIHSHPDAFAAILGTQQAPLEYPSLIYFMHDTRTIAEVLPGFVSYMRVERPFLPRTLESYRPTVPGPKGIR